MRLSWPRITAAPVRDQYRFQELAEYNTRVSKGIVHTPEYVERMRLEQEAFDKWTKTRNQ
jgi:hypothetical protein